MKLEGKQLNVDDVTLNYYEKGRGETIIFIHGNDMSSKIFKKMYQYFSNKYNVIAIDSRGQGLSSAGKKKYSLDLFADDIIKFCKKKCIKQSILVGYSDGANIAKKRPNLIRKMVVISGNLAVDGIHKWFRLFLRIYRKIWAVLRKYNSKSTKKVWLIDLMLKDIGVEKEDLKNINIPTLILFADMDVIYRDHIVSIHRNIRGSFLREIRGCTHVSIINKKTSLKEIDKFLLI